MYGLDDDNDDDDTLSTHLDRYSIFLIKENNQKKTNNERCRSVGGTLVWCISAVALSSTLVSNGPTAGLVPTGLAS